MVICFFVNFSPQRQKIYVFIMSISSRFVSDEALNVDCLILYNNAKSTDCSIMRNLLYQFKHHSSYGIKVFCSTYDHLGPNVLTTFLKLQYGLLIRSPAAATL